MAEPEDEAEDAPDGQRSDDEQARRWERFKGDQNHGGYDQKADGMSGEIADAASSERTDLVVIDFGVVGTSRTRIAKASVASEKHQSQIRWDVMLCSIAAREA